MSKKYLIEINIDDISSFTNDSLLKIYEDIKEITDNAILEYKRNKPWKDNEYFRDLGKTILVRGKIKK